MFKVGEKYKLLDPEFALMDDTEAGTILTVERIDGDRFEAKVFGELGKESSELIDTTDLNHGSIEKL